MLDAKTQKILTKILTQCKDGGYAVISYSDLLEECESENSTEEVKHTVMFLIEKEFLSCKYYDDENICIIPLPKGRLTEEEISEKDKKIDNFNNNSLKKIFFISFLSSFLSSALIFTILFILFRCFYA